ncbi:unnamed protein product [Bursaphelenchus okinawaensis]|uniref:Uncharacterized protein n=1 Tax=Bursaphelenchus okinawaensis TaxID=465554 RepID=A0A811L8C3_9BILA|nr:unnamed protein product [Bursaphelenchus okinawaensis]CAG9117726.1 unnamed protein product [Bursaphelenchus okinawaensis]
MSRHKTMARSMVKEIEVPQDRKCQSRKLRELVSLTSIDPTVKIIDNTNVIDNKQIMFDKFYANVQHTDEMAHLLERAQFKIYYRKTNFRWDIPAELPMYLAYKDQNEKMYHFPIVQGTVGLAGLQWSLKIPFNMPKVTCSSLSKLLQHYENYSFVVLGTGFTEAFPVWQLKERPSKSTETSGFVYQ